MGTDGGEYYLSFGINPSPLFLRFSIHTCSRKPRGQRERDFISKHFSALGVGWGGLAPRLRLPVRTADRRPPTTRKPITGEFVQVA